MKKIKIISIFFITIILASVTINPVNKVFAVNEFYSSNDILFYDSEDTGCISVASSANMTQPSKDNQDIAAKFFSTTNFSGNSDKPMNAIQMAAIMGNLQQDSGFNPNKGEGGSYFGIAQWKSPGRWDLITDPKTDLNTQLNFIKTELDSTYKNSLSEFWIASTTNDQDKATYAIARNYVNAISPGKDSSSTTSWTSTTDATNNILDWAKRQSYAGNFYNDYRNLAESGYVPGPECGGLVSGGMTLTEAEEFMNTYKNLQPKEITETYKISYTDCEGGALYNCVAFSQYFINRYTKNTSTNTNTLFTSPRDAKYTVEQLIGLGFTPGYNTPKVYSVFSRSSGDHGHTGVVLGIDVTKDEIIIGQASCGDGESGVTAVKKVLSKYSTSDYTYAYTDGRLTGSL